MDLFESKNRHGEPTNMDLSDKRIKFTPAEPQSDYPVDWLEFGDTTTAHHLHDYQQRLDMMQRYLDQQYDDYRFEPNWLDRKITWNP